MKIRSFIFLFVIALGLFPVFILVALNLPKTMERLEYAAELETQANSHVDFTQLNARIQCLKKSLIRSATLPSAQAAFHNPKERSVLAKVVKKWFEKDEQVKGLMLIDAEGEELLSLHRNESGFMPAKFSENHKYHLFFSNSLTVGEDHVFVNLVDHKSDPFRRTNDEEYELIMATPVVATTLQTVGILLMRIDLSEFLKNFKGSFWVTGDGNYFRGCQQESHQLPATYEKANSDCNAFADFPGLQIIETSDPLILPDNSKTKIAWMPLVFNRDERPVMWVGTTVDESAIQKWKMTLIINVVVLIVIMSAVVFISANWISTKLEYLQKDLLDGLDDIINKEKITKFNWGGPQELQNLSRDLTALAESYSATCDARNLAEASLSESEDKFRSLTGSAKDGIILMDNEGYITYWNEAATTIFGYSSEEALQHPVHSLISPRRAGDDLSVEPLEKVGVGSSIAKTVELVVRNKDDNNVHVELSLSSTSINKQWHAIWIVRDISERKRSDEETKRQQQHLIHADKMISLGLLVSGVAHEINNPNSIALLNTPILLRSWESAKPILDEYYEEHGDFSIGGIEYSEMRHNFARIFLELEESAIRIKEIVADLKDYARQETSGQMSPVDITEVVKSGVRLTANSIRKSTNNFITNYSSDSLMVLGNRQRLTQVVINLIQNSCEALDKTDLSLTVSTRYNKTIDAVEISIIDEGSGIAPEDLKQVTDPFFTTKRSVGGTGLGLSVSAGIVKEHNGVMNFHSEVGKGTEVVIVFPALDKDKET
jgi:PAS domain S-box-containing protein